MHIHVFYRQQAYLPNSFIQKRNFDFLLHLHVQVTKTSTTDSFYSMVHCGKRKIRTFNTTETCTSKNFSYLRLLTRLMLYTVCISRAKRKPLLCT